MTLSIAILISAHGIRQKAISCLDDCLRQIDSLAGEGKYSFQVYFMDDASGDGTYEQVENQFQQVKLFRSNQRLFLNGALRTLWKHASSENPDFYLWLDARISLADNALSTLLETSTFLSHNAIIAGSICDEKGSVIRGGRTKKGKISEPDPIIPIPTTTFDGNVVLVPRSAFKTLGMTSSKRKEFLGDWEYGLKAFRMDVPRVIAPGIIGTCADIPYERNPRGSRFIYDLRSSSPFFAISNFFRLTFESVLHKKITSNS